MNLSKKKKENFLTLSPKHDDGFTWGPVKKIHTIGNFDIVEYFPMIFKDCCGTGKYETKKTSFSLYVDGLSTSLSYNSLEVAIIGGIDNKYNGMNSNLAYPIARQLRIGKKRYRN